MRRTYLLLIDLTDNDNIYIDYQNKEFIIEYYEYDIIFNNEEAKDFITIFVNDLDRILKKLNITRHGK